MIITIYVNLSLSLPIKKNFLSFILKRFENLTGLNGTVMDSIYSELTRDASTNRNREMDIRIQLAMQGEPGIIVDLRKMNKGRPGETFQNFFSVMEEVVNEVKILYTIINKI